MKDRTPVKKESIETAITWITEKLYDRMHQEDKGFYYSIHEFRGSLDEEVNELKNAMHDKNITEVLEEIQDVAVCCIIALASIFERNIK